MDRITIEWFLATASALKPKNSKEKVKVVYVLTGGGAKGVTQNGALQALEEFGMFPPDAVQGISVGGLNALGIGHKEGNSKLHKMFNFLRKRSHLLT